MFHLTRCRLFHFNIFSPLARTLLARLKMCLSSDALDNKIQNNKIISIIINKDNLCKVDFLSHHNLKLLVVLKKNLATSKPLSEHSLNRSSLYTCKMMIGGIRILSRRYGGAYAYHPSSTRSLISTSTYCRTICNNNNNNNNNNKPLILSATDTATDNATDNVRYYPLSWSTLTLTPLIGGGPHKYRQRRWINTDSSSNNNNNTNDASPTYTPLPSSSRKKQKKGKMKNKKQRGRKSYRFVDRTRLQLSGGGGGRGCTSMFLSLIHI